VPKTTTRSLLVTGYRPGYRHCHCSPGAGLAGEPRFDSIAAIVHDEGIRIVGDRHCLSIISATVFFLPDKPEVEHVTSSRYLCIEISARVYVLDGIEICHLGDTRKKIKGE
jgi:hypothetical protein